MLKSNTKKEIILSFLATLLISLFPVLFLLLNNIGNVQLKETILPIILCSLIGIGIWLVSSIFLRSFINGSICGCLISIFGFNFKLFENGYKSIFKTIKYWHLLPVIIFLIIVLMTIICKINLQTRKDLNLIIVIVLGTLITFNVFQAIPSISSFLVQEKASNKKESDTMQVNTNISSDLPNIYWLIFDEYSNFDVLEKYYDYDNYKFAQFLEEKGFTVSYDSVNESQQTMTILSNYVHLDYVTDDSISYSERQKIMTEGTVFNLLQGYNYTINTILGGENFGLSNEKKVTSTTMAGEDFSSLIINNSAIYPWFTKDAYRDAQIYIDAFRNLQKIDASKSATPEMYFAYFNLPHQPFCFDSKGNKVPLSHINDWVNKEYYLGQLIYTTTQIEQTIKAILENDADSIIILQSDHSARSLQTESGDYLIEKFDRRHFLNAIYYRGQDIEEIKGESGVNTLRIVFERLLNIDLPELEVPVSEYEF